MLKTARIVTFIITFTLFRMYVFYSVYIRLKQTDNFKTECTMTVFCHFPNVTPMNFNIEV